MMSQMFQNFIAKILWAVVRGVALYVQILVTKYLDNNAGQLTYFSTIVTRILPYKTSPQMVDRRAMTMKF